MLEDRSEGFTDDWAAAVAEVENQMSSRAHGHATLLIESQTLSNPDLGPWPACRVTESIHKKQSHLAISP